MNSARLEILYEDNHLLAVNKPPGLPTMGVTASKASLVTLAKQYIKHRYRKPGNVYLGVVSRLDAGSSGVVVLARTSKAAARLNEQFRARKVQKIYWAILSRRPQDSSGELIDWVRKDESEKRMMITGAGTRGAKEAHLRYKLLRELPGGALVEVELLTGRKHQIRLQFAARGLALWGETKYAAARPFGHGIALHSRRTVIAHPVRGTPLEFTAPLPPAWRAVGIQ